MKEAATLEGILERLAPYITVKRHATLRQCADEVLAHFGRGTRPSLRKLKSFLQKNKELARWLGHAKTCPLRTALPDVFPPAMCPAAGPPSTWNLLPLVTEGDIASWLGLTYG